MQDPAWKITEDFGGGGGGRVCARGGMSSSLVLSRPFWGSCKDGLLVEDCRCMEDWHVGEAVDHGCLLKARGISGEILWFRV